MKYLEYCNFSDDVYLDGELLCVYNPDIDTLDALQRHIEDVCECKIKLVESWDTEFRFVTVD